MLSHDGSNSEIVFVKAAECVCGRTKGKQRHSVTWWWTGDDEVRSALAKKREAFKFYERAKNSMEGEVEVLKKKYQITKVNAKRIVAKAKDAERERGYVNSWMRNIKREPYLEWQSK